jgi:DNA-binding CsgD family transcriptional regulator
MEASMKIGWVSAVRQRLRPPSKTFPDDYVIVYRRSALADPPGRPEMLTMTVAPVADDATDEPGSNADDCDAAVLQALKFTCEVEPEGQADSEIARAGLPVIERLAEDLGDLAISIELTDSQANVIGRVVGRHVPESALDRVRSTAAAPITDPRRALPVGAVDVTCAIPGAGALLLPYAQLAARTITDRLVDRAAAAERVLLEQFLRLRRRARGAILAVNGNELLTNAAAARLVGPEDHARIWTWAKFAAESNELTTGDLRIGAETVTARCEPVRVGRDVVGALVHLGEVSPTSRTRGARRSVPSTGRPSLGWESMRSSELGIAELVAAGLTNREVAARLFVSPHTVDFHLRQIYRKLSITSRIELTRMVLEYATLSSGTALLVR